MYEAFALFFVFSLYAIYRGSIENNRAWFRWGTVISIATIFVHIIGVVLALIYFALALKPQIHRIKKSILVFAGGVITCIGLVQYFLINYGFSLSAQAGLIGPSLNFIDKLSALKEILAFPKLYFWGFVSAFPLMAIPVIAGLFILIRRSIRPQCDSEAFFVTIGFLIPLLANGFLANRFVEYRLNFYLNPLFILIYAFVAVEGFHRLNRWLEAKTDWQKWRKPLLAVSIAAIAFGCQQINPKYTADVLTRQYGSPVKKTTIPGSHLTIMPDHASPGNYVRTHKQDGDIVIVTDWLAQVFYMGKADFWLRTNAYKHQTISENGRIYDIYTATEVITSLQGLKKLLECLENKTLWIITTIPFIDSSLHVSADMLEYLESLEEYIVCRGRDGNSKVYRLSVAQ